MQLAGALILGDLNCAAGGAEHDLCLRYLATKPPIDLCGPASDASFPLGAWGRGRYALCEPRVRLDYVLDCSAAVCVPGDAHSDAAPSLLRATTAYVACDAAKATERERARMDVGGVVSDHAPVLAFVTL